MAKMSGNKHCYVIPSAVFGAEPHDRSCDKTESRDLWKFGLRWYFRRFLDSAYLRSAKTCSARNDMKGRSE